MAESYYCFFPSTPMWVGPRPDFSALEGGDTLVVDIMSEQVCRFQGNGYILTFCKDGLCMACIDSLDNEMKDIRTKESASSISSDLRKRLNLRWLELHRQYIRYLNAIQLLLDSALFQVDPHAFMNTTALRGSDVFPIVIDETKLVSVIDYSGTGSLHAGRDKLRRFRRMFRYAGPTPIEEDETVTCRSEIPEAIFEETHKQFGKVHEDETRVDVLSQALVAVDNYNVSNFSVSLVQSWFLIELFINMYWEKWLTEKQNVGPQEPVRINSDRRKYLLGRDLTAAVVSNVLELTDCIDFDLFRKIDTLRKKRNVVSHSLDRKSALASTGSTTKSNRKREKGASADDCRTAFQVVDHFIAQEYGISLGIGGAVF